MMKCVYPKLFAFMKEAPIARLILAFIGVFFLVAVYLLVSPDTAKQVVRHAGYWFTLVAFSGAVFYGVRLGLEQKQKLQDRELNEFCQQWFPWCCFVLLISGMVFVHAEIGPKIMMDDEVLVSTAKNLHLSREVHTPTYGRWIHQSFDYFEGYVDKRPWMYPFCVSLVHDLSGYRLQNPYIFNGLISVVIIAALAILGGLLSGRRGAILLPLLWLTVPLFQQNATGAGMDLLNVLMLVLILIFAINYWRRLDANSEGLLALAGVMLAYTRYESVLFLPIIACIIVIGWYLRGAIILSAGTIFAAPLLLGVFLQNKFFVDTTSLWEFRAGVVEPFSFSNLPVNSVGAVDFFFNVSDAYANSLWLSMLGAVAVVFFVVYCVRENRLLLRAKPEHAIAFLMGLGLCIHFIVILCYYEGRLDRLAASRFALPMYLLMSYCVVIVAEHFHYKRAVWRCLVVGSILFLIGFTLPMNSKAIFTHRNFVAEEVQWVEQELSSRPKVGLLIVSQYSLSWTLRNYSSLTAPVAIASADRLSQELENGKFTELYLVDELECDRSPDGDLLLQSQLPLEVFSLETIAERSFRPFYLTRISRIKAFNLDLDTLRGVEAYE